MRPGYGRSPTYATVGACARGSSRGWARASGRACSRGGTVRWIVPAVGSARSSYELDLGFDVGLLLGAVGEREWLARLVG